jgi:protein-disulfide isomerase
VAKHHAAAQDVRGPLDAPITVIEFGDLQCLPCGRAEPVVRDLLPDDTDIDYVWRHLPLTGVHPQARLAAEASEASAAHGAFWDIHDLLLAQQEHGQRHHGAFDLETLTAAVRTTRAVLRV